MSATTCEVAAIGTVLLYYDNGVSIGTTILEQGLLGGGRL